jgi:hypothetical protein
VSCPPGTKYDGEKPRYDLIDPEVEELLAMALTYGAQKYADDNWKQVKDGKNRYYAAMRRHANAMRRGEHIDEESGLPHSACMMACCHFVTWFDLQKMKGCESKSCSAVDPIQWGPA